jgi:hypothetical protein
MVKRDYSKVQKDPKPKSIWDEDVDFSKVQKLSKKQKHLLLPNDFAPDGEPYGDF